VSAGAESDRFFLCLGNHLQDGRSLYWSIAIPYREWGILCVSPACKTTSPVQTEVYIEIQSLSGVEPYTVLRKNSRRTGVYSLPSPYILRMAQSRYGGDFHVAKFHQGFSKDDFSKNDGFGAVLTPIYGGIFVQAIQYRYGSLFPPLKTEAHSGNGNWCSSSQYSAPFWTVHSKRLTLKVIPRAAPKVGSFSRADRSSARSTILMCGSQFWDWYG